MSGLRQLCAADADKARRQRLALAHIATEQQLEAQWSGWSESPHGKLRFGVPQHALRFYFPALWPEAEAQAQ